MHTGTLRDEGAANGWAGGYRIWSSGPAWGLLWPDPAQRELVVRDRGAAVTLAAKSSTLPGESIEVIHIASGEVVFRKSQDSGRG